MDRESIIGDLRKYSGGACFANAQKITVEEIPVHVEVAPVVRGRPKKPVAEKKIENTVNENKVEETNKVVKEKPKNKVTVNHVPVVDKPEVTVESIAALIKPPFTVIKTGDVLSQDKVTLRVKCEVGHQHSVYIKDVLSGDGVVTCRTCTTGTKFIVMARQCAEQILGIPLSMNDNQTINKTHLCELVHEDHMLTIQCDKINLVQKPPVMNDDRLVIHIPNSSSIKKIRTSLLESLKTTKDWFVEEIQENISKEADKDKPKARKEATNLFRKDRIPHISASADDTIKLTKASNPLLTRMHMNIINDSESSKFFIESCEIVNNGLKLEN